MVVGMLGVLKAGGAFLPCDPPYPRERLAYMVADAEVPVILATKKLVAELPEHPARVLHLDYESECGSLRSARTLDNFATPDSLAYLIYTFGSTGCPKGVRGLHRGAVNRMQWIWRTHPYQPGEVCCQKAPFDFVHMVAEVFTPLLRGVPVVIVPDATVRDPVRLIETLSSDNVTRITVVATLLRMMLHASSDLQAQLLQLKYWVSTGEELPLELQRSFFAGRPGSELHNFYGATEASTDVSHSQCERGRDGVRVPIGRPLSNNFLHVLNSDLQAVPVDGAGELHIAGVGLARGYLNRPALTAQTFVPTPYGEQVGARLYRSGDLARLTAEGVIEYLGRADGQVKIRGHRIELGEIEAALYCHRHVCEAVVVAKEHCSGGLKLMVYMAYIGAAETEVVTSAEGATSSATDSLRP
jgi:amino acid adenylation domain-containing protein